MANRYVTKQEGAGEAHFEVVWEEARVVRRVFEWGGRDRCSIGVDASLFDAVQEQLRENRQRARVQERGAKYLLQGLIVCACCGYASNGKAISPSARKYHERSYAY